MTALTSHLVLSLWEHPGQKLVAVEGKIRCSNPNSRKWSQRSLLLVVSTWSLFFWLVFTCAVPATCLLLLPPPLRDDAVRPDPGAAGCPQTLLLANRLRFPHRRGRGVDANAWSDSRLVETEAKVATHEHEAGQQFFFFLLFSTSSWAGKTFFGGAATLQESRQGLVASMPHPPFFFLVFWASEFVNLHQSACLLPPAGGEDFTNFQLTSLCWGKELHNECCLYWLKSLITTLPTLISNSDLKYRYKYILKNK